MECHLEWFDIFQWHVVSDEKHKFLHDPLKQLNNKREGAGEISASQFDLVKKLALRQYRDKIVEDPDLPTTRCLFN